MGRWVVAIVRDGSEIDLAAELLNVGIQSYCPIHKSWRKLPKHIARKTGRTRELVVSAIIKGYIFAMASSQEDLALVKSFKPVFGFVSTSSGPCYARTSDIEAMEALESLAAREPRKAKEVKETIKQCLSSMDLTDYVGKKVRFNEGPFRGIIGAVQSINSKLGELSIEANRLTMTVKASQVELT